MIAKSNSIGCDVKSDQGNTIAQVIRPPKVATARHLGHIESR